MTDSRPFHANESADRMMLYLQTVVGRSFRYYYAPDKDATTVELPEAVLIAVANRLRKAEELLELCEESYKTLAEYTTRLAERLVLERTHPDALGPLKQRVEKEAETLRQTLNESSTKPAKGGPDYEYILRQLPSGKVFYDFRCRLCEEQSGPFSTHTEVDTYARGHPCTSCATARNPVVERQNELESLTVMYRRQLEKCVEMLGRAPASLEGNVALFTETKEMLDLTVKKASS